MPSVPYPYEVNWHLVTGNGSLIPICSLSNSSLLPSLTVLYIQALTKNQLLIAKCQVKFFIFGKIRGNNTPARTPRINGLKSQVLQPTFLASALESLVLKFYQPLQSFCCPVQKNLPRKAELTSQLLKGLVEFQNKKNARQLFTIIFMTKMVDSRPEILVHIFYELQVV